MDGLGIILTLIVLWAWFEPEKVGRWIGRARDGLRRHNNSSR